MPNKRLPLTQQVSVLLFARMSSMVLRFFLPIVLVRVFAKSDYGLYRQLVLMEGFAVVLATGLESSFFYFIPRHPERRLQLVFQTMLVNGAAGLIFLFVVTVWREPIAAWMNNPALAPYLPLAGLLVLLALSSEFVSDLMIAEGKAKLAALLAGGLETLRVLSVTGAALLTRNIMTMMVCWVSVTALRPLILLFYVGLSSPPGAPRFSWKYLWEQVQYGVPLGLSSTTTRIRGQAAGFFVSNLFTPAQFAAYSIGHSRVPFASNIFTTFSDVIAPRMSEYHAQGNLPAMIDLWHKAVSKLALVVFPMIAVSAFLAESIIVVLYTAEYRDSIPVFVVFNFNLLIGMLPYGSIMKAFGETRFIFTSNLLATVLLVLLGYPVVRALGPVGAAGLMVGAVYLNMGQQALRIRRLLGVTWRDYFPWANLGKTVLAAVIPGLATYAIQTRLPENLPVLVGLLSLYAVLYLLLLHASGLWALNRESLSNGIRKVLGGRRRGSRKGRAVAAGRPVEGR